MGGMISSNLVARYDFVQGASVETLYDLTANALNGTRAVAPATPTWTAQGMSFDGGDYVVIPNNALFSFGTGDFTIVVVLKPSTWNLSGVLPLGKRNGTAHAWSAYQSKSKIGFTADGGTLTYCLSGMLSGPTIPTVGGFWTAVAIRRQAGVVSFLKNSIMSYGSYTGAQNVTAAADIWIGGMEAGSHGYWTGEHAALLFYNAALTNAQWLEEYEWLRTSLADRGIALPGDIARPWESFVFDGDSLTLGSGVSGSSNYPSQLLSLLGGAGASFNFGSGGQTIAGLITAGPATVDTLHESSRTRNVVCVWAGTNDFAITGRTVDDTYADLQTYCAARRAVGFRVVVVTMLPRGTDGTVESKRIDYNNRIRTNWATFADALGDVAADTRIGDPGDQNDLTYYNSDKVHLTVAGYAVVAEVVAAAIRRFGSRQVGGRMTGGRWQ